MVKKQLPEDFKEFIKCLNANKVKYLLLGGWAVSTYGEPRATKDIDFLVSKDDKNLFNLDKALKDFCSPPLDVNILKESGCFFRMGQPPIMIEIINEASGIEFNDCYKRKNIIIMDGVAVKTISVTDLIKNKRAAGRGQDIADIEILEKICNKRKKL